MKITYFGTAAGEAFQDYFVTVHIVVKRESVVVDGLERDHRH